MRLIDADEFIKNLKSATLSNGTLLNTNTVIALVEKYPTAYDVDKVVEQLKENSKIYCEEYHQREGSLYLQDVIEIVKQGGVSNGG